MGWLILALVALLVLGIAGIAAPGVFGPILGGLAPLIFVIALIGLGAVWWRHADRRVDPVTEDATDEPDEVRGENERVET